jgi:ubiquitin-protein ligase
MSKKVNTNVTTASRTKALLGNYKRCTVKDIHPHIKFVMKEDDVGVWNFIIGVVDSDNTGEFSGNNDEFLKGQFIGQITAPKMYPYGGPPSVMMRTPTGVYPVGTEEYCVDINKYHPGDYPASYGMDGFTKMIFSGLYGWEDLIGGFNILLSPTTPHKEQVEIIRKASLDSQEYNRKYNADLLKLFCPPDDEQKEVSKKEENMDDLLRKTKQCALDNKKK